MSTDKQSLDWYNENSQHYTDHVRNPHNSIYHAYYEKPAMYALVPDLQNKTVISLGCGPGEDSNYLQKQGAKMSIGIDLSNGLLAHAREAYKDCEFHEMDMEKLLFENESFEFAYSSLAIHYIEDWTQTFKEAFRILKPNSYFLFSCNHPTASAMEITEDEKNNILTLQVKRSKAEKTVEVTGSYFPRKKLMDALGKNTVNTWHKPMSEIISEAQSAGFVIDRIVEPLPTEVMKELSPRTYEELHKVPGFLIIRLLKT